MTMFGPEGKSTLRLLGLISASSAVCALRTTSPGRAVVGSFSAGAALAGMVGIQHNRVTDHVQAWRDVLRAMFTPSPEPYPLPLPPKPDVWQGKDDSRYRVRLEEISAPGAGQASGYFYRVNWTGPASGISLPILMWAPRMWREEKELAVIELLPSFPGAPDLMPNQLHLDAVLTRAINAGELPPTMVVIAHVAVDSHEPDTFDLPGRPKVATWVGRDIPAMLVANFPVSTDAKSWAIGGMSAGGFSGPVLGALLGDTFANIMSFSGADRAELGGIARAGGELAQRFSLTSLVAKRPELNVWAYAAGNEYFGGQAVGGLAKLALSNKRTGSTVLLHDPYASHSWASWGDIFPQCISWFGEVLAGARPVSLNVPPDLLDAHGRPSFALAGVYVGIGLAAVAGVATIKTSGGGDGAVVPVTSLRGTNVGKKLARAMGVGLTTVSACVAAVTIVDRKFANLRHINNIVTFMRQLGWKW
ncbi:alpha/beta hydrolase [Arcanobacterium canis]